MQRRTLLAGTASLLPLGGCLDVQSIDEEGDIEDDAEGDGDEDFYESGTIEVSVDGEPVDLTADRFQAEYADEDVRFHFHAGDDRWHMEHERVTIAEGIDLLPRFTYGREDGAHVVTVDGTTYDGRDAATEISFRVDGESVDTESYEVKGGDHVDVEITTGE